MANTYVQLHNQFVFATKYRNASIHSSWKDRLEQYITAIIQAREHKMLQINSMPDHIHILVGMRPHQSISSLIQLVKSESTKWIKEERLCPYAFAWQEGFGAFSYSKSQVPQVINYIRQQELHHQKKTFKQEYLYMLKIAGVEFDERYIFEDPV